MLLRTSEHVHGCCCTANQTEMEKNCDEDVDTQLLGAFELKADIETLLDES
jgi:hypothetical protein